MASKGAEVTTARGEASRRILQDLRDIEDAVWNHIAVQPISPDNVLELHVNIIPQKGCLESRIIHLIMTFPESFPDQPPKVEVEAPIQNPMVQQNFFAFPILTTEGWAPLNSTIKQVLTEIEAFFNSFQASPEEVETITKFVKEYSHPEIGHTYKTPVPRLKVGLVTADDGKTYVNNPSSDWQVAKATTGVGWGKVMYEACLDKVEIPPQKHTWSNPSEICSCRFGWATGDSEESAISGIFYGNGKNSHIVIRSKKMIHKFMELQPNETFRQGDVICAGVDFDTKRAWFARNGKRVGDASGYVLPTFLHGQTLFPVVGLQNSAVQLNFGEPKSTVPDTENFVTIDIQKSLSKTEYLWNTHRPVKWNEKLFSNKDFDSNNVFSFLRKNDLSKCEAVCKNWNELIKQGYLRQRSKLRCFLLRESYQSKHCILGLGVSISYKEGHITTMTSECEYLSLAAWNRGTRKGPSGVEYTHFIPLIIDSTHAKRSYPVFQNLFSSYLPEQNVSFDASGILTVMTSLMNGAVCALASDVEEPNAKMISNQLELYSHIHHLCLYLDDVFKSALANEADEKIAQTFVDKTLLYRKHLFDVGTFLLMTSVGEQYDWKKLRKKVLLEIFDRDVPSYLQRYPDLERRDDDIEASERLAKVMDCTTLSRRKALMQIFFVAYVNSGRTLEEYNDRFGAPCSGMLNESVKRITEVYQVDTWTKYFAGLYLKEQNQAFVKNILLESLDRAIDKGYYVPQKIEAPVVVAHTQQAPDPVQQGQLPIVPKGPVGPRQCETFADLVPPLAGSLEGVEPLELQKEALPLITSGKEVAVIAPLASGKHTLAAITIVHKIISSPPQSQVLVFVPERNHAIHFEEILADIYLAVPPQEMRAKKIPLNVCICAAKENYPTRDQLRHRTVFVGTVGRIHEMLLKNQINVVKLQAVYILEGDQLMQGKDKNRIFDCFRGDGDRFGGIHAGVQCLFFSNTMTTSIKQSVDMILGNEATILDRSQEENYDRFSHHYVGCIHDSKKLPIFDLLCRVLEYEQAIAYVSSDIRANKFHEELTTIGTCGKIGLITKRMNSEERRTAVKEFNEGEMKLLITEDVALYGMKVQKVNAVIHVDVPTSYGGTADSALSSYKRRLSNFVSNDNPIKSINFSIRNRQIESFLHSVQDTYGLEELPDDPNSV